uniref:tRNA(Ile)-lysidine synthase n=1 Tax=Kumanoa americana TaxID=1196377 RepID=A0A1C9CGL0_9FLOR|nr:tRNA(Ile)-lysidine synthase [Kumanoa americana]AOM67526.1 tRNA(Ile)-lysidine synthase [Kumanoa americana]
MNTFLHRKFELNLLRALKINTDDSILLAISGGQDSLCLLKLSLDLRAKYRFKVGIIHIDHQWRYDSSLTTKHLINLMKSYCVPTYIYQIHSKVYSELEARNFRHQLFIQTAETYQYTMIATAHSCTDQIETCLHNLLRGTSIDGLTSMIWARTISDKIKLIKPMLNFTRSDILWFSRYFHLPIWSDFSNFYYCTIRNRIRQELIPYLKLYFQVNIENQIPYFLQNIYVDVEYLRQNTIKLYQKSRHKNLVAINKKILLSQHYSLQIRVLQLFFLHNFNKVVSLNLLEHIRKCCIRERYFSFPIFTSGIIIDEYQHWLYCQ